MTKADDYPVKAYKNLDFINSPDARILRILAEYLEPRARFAREKVYDTVIFFGSARTPSLADAQQQLKDAEHHLAQAGPQPGLELAENLEMAKNQVFLAHYYEDAVELARRITEWSKALESSYRFVVCSGGGPGMMEAANRGAQKAGGKSIGLNISLPMEEQANPYITPELNFEFHYFFMRKFWFIYLAKALVIFPGGFGTLDELFEILTLVQTGKVRKNMPIVIYGQDYWDKIINIDNMARYGVISREDLDLFRFCNSVDEAFAHLTGELMKHYVSR